MNKLVKLSYILAVALSLTACGKPTLDTSSDKAIKESVGIITSELSKDDQARFKKALIEIYMIGTLANLGNNKSKDEVKAEINTRIDGKTAEEIIELADELKQRIKNSK